MTRLHPGAVDTDPESVSNRQAIINLLAAYGHFANVGDMEGWSDCFTRDATYRISCPGAPGEPLPIAQVIAAETPQFAAYRRMMADPMSGERKIYCLVNPYITRLNGAEASVICQLVQLRAAPEGPQPRIQLTGTYQGDLVRRDGVWRLRRWEVNTTRKPESVSEVPATWWLNVAASPDGDWRDHSPG